MDMTDKHGQESQNTNTIALYVSIVDLKVNRNKCPVDGNEISIYFLCITPTVEVF
jgi:hypothetical protein